MIPIPIIDASIEPPYKGVQSLVQQLESYKILMDLEIEKAYPGHLEAFGYHSIYGVNSCYLPKTHS